MQVWLLRISSMGGSGCKDEKGVLCCNGYTDTAFVDVGAANEWADRNDEEWRSYKPEANEGFEVVVSSIDCVAVGRKIFNLDRSTSEDAIKSRALSKLSEEEKDALGLN